MPLILLPIPVVAEKPGLFLKSVDIQKYSPSLVAPKSPKFPPSIPNMGCENKSLLIYDQFNQFLVVTLPLTLNKLLKDD